MNISVILISYIIFDNVLQLLSDLLKEAKCSWVILPMGLVCYLKKKWTWQYVNFIISLDHKKYRYMYIIVSGLSWPNFNSSHNLEN